MCCCEWRHPRLGIVVVLIVAVEAGIATAVVAVEYQWAARRGLR
jgi:hypothetical protein